ncbi:hypothetical protein [Nocardia australiensis]|uniref:hypothetical protein n=1 Tax=Nocardia australiensis TaxID=2887191 RepID=UPI001D1407F1|nr:hypothetical protein [Nocardia australiensis]
MITNSHQLAARRLLTCAAIVGAITTASAGMAFAESHNDHSSGRGGSYSDGDTTGAHHIDPRGYMHTDSDPLEQSQHDDALRAYHERQNQVEAAQNTSSSNSRNSTWNQVQNSEGGWKVCKAQATWCK